MNELKPRPCPFCGCEPTLARIDDNVFSVRCTHHYCWSEPDENGARTAADITIYADIEGKYNYETKDWEYTEEEINNCKKAAIEAWNTRAERTCHTDERTTTRHGKFKTKYGNRVPLCECCGYSIGDKRYNFCPNCGAKIIE